jgi:hypothetical protein
MTLAVVDTAVRLAEPRSHLGSKGSIGRQHKRAALILRAENLGDASERQP